MIQAKELNPKGLIYNMKKNKLTALILSAVMLLPMTAVSASADDAETAAVEELIELQLEGLTRVQVTSSIAKLNGEDKDIAAEDFYDRLASTGYKVSLEEGEKMGEKTLSVYTATRVPEAIEAFAMLFEAEPATVLAVNVYATNDSLLLDWKQLTVENPVEKNGDFHVISFTDAPEKYSFYRIDITLENGKDFTVNEIIPYKDASDTSYYYWADTDELEAGELPELIEVPAEKENKQPYISPFSPFSTFLPQAFRK